MPYNKLLVYDLHCFDFKQILLDMFEVALEYYGLAVLASIATIQAAASYNNINGITFFKNRSFNYLFSAIIIITCLGALLTWNWRNPIGMVEGAQQFYIFMLGLISAIAATAIISSIINHSRFNTNQEPLEAGLEGLRERTFYQAITLLLRSNK